VQQNPIDAIPDLSENQVIVFTEWMGRSPQVIEAQVTYPLVSNLQGIPKVKNIRGASMFGMSFVYIIFEDDVDIYWARTRVLERLNYAQRLLPQNVVPTLGPDGTGVGHVFWYHLNADGMDLGEQRALQDWYVKFALQTVPGVAEVASFGGFEKQYQLVLDPLKMQYYNVSMMEVMNAVKANNNDVGGRKFEMSDMSYIIRGLGYIKNIKDVEEIAIKNYNSVPVKVKDIGSIQMGGDLRLGIFEQNGEGEVVGGIRGRAQPEDLLVLGGDAGQGGAPERGQFVDLGLLAAEPFAQCRDLALEARDLGLPGVGLDSCVAKHGALLVELGLEVRVGPVERRPGDSRDRAEAGDVAFAARGHWPLDEQGDRVEDAFFGVHQVGSLPVAVSMVAMTRSARCTAAVARARSSGEMRGLLRNTVRVVCAWSAHTSRWVGW